jgi:hypothetical protein
MALSGILLVVALGFGAWAVLSATADRFATVPGSQATSSAAATPHVATSSTAAPSATSSPYASVLVIESGPDVWTVISSLGAVAAVLVAVAQWMWPRRRAGPAAAAPMAADEPDPQ